MSNLDLCRNPMSSGELPIRHRWIRFTQRLNGDNLATSCLKNRNRILQTPAANTYLKAHCLSKKSPLKSVGESEALLLAKGGPRKMSRSIADRQKSAKEKGHDRQE